MARFLIVVALTALVCGAQSKEQAKVSGLVQDVAGWRVPNTTVTIMRAGDTKVAAVATTNLRGIFSVVGLAAGSYDICFTSPGFERFCETSVVVKPGINDLDRVRLRLETQGGIVVEAPAP